MGGFIETNAGDTCEKKVYPEGKAGLDFSSRQGREGGEYLQGHADEAYTRGGMKEKLQSTLNTPISALNRKTKGMPWIELRL